MTAEMFNRGLITREDIKRMEYEIKFSNGLGRIHLKDRSAQLHKVLERDLQGCFKTMGAAVQASTPSIYLLYLPAKRKSTEIIQPGEDRCRFHCHLCATGKSPHNYLPSLAFDIVFKISWASLTDHQSCLKNLLN